MSKTKKRSPSHLIRFMESPFASWMDKYAVHFPDILKLKDAPDPLANTLQQRGFAHEEQLENTFKEQGLSFIRLEGESDAEKLQATLNAMKQSFDVIAQARLEMDGFIGYADFLVKVPTKSPSPNQNTSHFGNYHYEVWDTKLSKHLKTSHIIQLCCYAEMLENIQGIRPEYITVVLGNNERKIFRTNDCFQYYLGLKKSFLLSDSQFDHNTMPDPANSKSFGDWSTYAEQLLKEKDHLSQVANISKSQILKLNKFDIFTMQDLADTKLENIPGLNTFTFKALIKQADIQKRSQGLAKPLYEVVVPNQEEKQGLALLPPASFQDVFFDIEGFPLFEGGLEYLWGCTYFNEAGERDFIDFWAHNQEEEKQAFENFIHWVYNRWKKDPNMHIYHYANYEIAACRKLMGRYGVCEEEVDQLLRNEVFVDLYKIVKAGLLLGEPRYSIKNVETLYRDKRKTEVGNGGDSIVVYENWRELHARGLEGGTWETSPILKSIRDYNIDDCDSTQELVDWLRKHQEKHNIAYIGKTELVEPEIKEEITARSKLRDRLLAKAKNKTEPNCPKAKLTENLAGMLEFHRREDKPVYWRLFDRLGLSHDDLFHDLECLAYCQRTSRPAFKLTPRTKNLSYEYRFDPAQEFKSAKKKYVLLGEETKKGKSVEVNFIPEESDLEAGLIVLQSAEEPKPLISLIPFEIVIAKPIPESIAEIVKDYDTGTLTNCAILDFLSRSKPRIKGHNGGVIVTSQNSDERLSQIIKAIENLDNSYLPIQGPPGAGKSYTATHVIAKLIAQGCKIGISSNSHKAINNLMLNTAKYCRTKNIKGSFVCTKETEPDLIKEGVIITENGDLANHIKPGCVLGTTAWGFARDDMADQLDYLFIDEAGQVAVANLVGMSRSAKNLILMGDQMQLGQPTQGTHPAESGLSILDYLLFDSPTISEEMGVFLDTTYRMHPEINEFISQNIYEDKLKSHPDNHKRIIKVPQDYQGLLNKEAGIIYIPIVHEGNTQSSEEEIAEIKKLATELIGRTLTTPSGEERQITLDDMLFLAPYNYQVIKLKEALGSDAKIGTVDKFQGQEAPIVFISMCTSDATESPRGLDFLLNKNRMNVAISRAQTLAIIVGNPNLGNTTVSHVNQLKLVNMFNAVCATRQPINVA